MRSLIPQELSSEFRLPVKSCIRGTIGEISPEVSRSHGLSEKIPMLEDYANRLRDEVKKIDAFKRELPLCMLLLRDAIVETEEVLSKCRKSIADPVLEEFIPLKKICKDEVDQIESPPNREVSCRDKMNWMNSVRLWNSTSHPSPDTDLNSSKLTLNLNTDKKRTKEEMDRLALVNLFPSGKNRAVTNYSRVMSIGKEDRHESAIPDLSLCTPEIKSSKEGVSPIGFNPNSCSIRSRSPPATNGQSKLSGQHQSVRKPRRWWSTDLHRLFINALQQLGGDQVATPKQIRELMRVDGLTNDEVKSHLQKYRLHSRRFSTNSSSRSVGLWTTDEHCNESLKPSQSGSPDGPFHLEGNSEEDEDENDETNEVEDRKGDI